MGLLDSVRTGLAARGPLDDRDQAIAELAQNYARALDEGDAELSDLGPKLQQALTALHMTPAARATAANGPDKPPAASPLDELRFRREQRGSS